MTENTAPLLLLDVDGPLNAFDGRKTLPERFRKYRVRPDDVTYNVYLDPGIGERLLAFARDHGAELVWATTWEHHANDWISPRIGLPELPVITFSVTRYARKGYSWKFADVAAYAAGRTLAWLDDDFEYHEPLRAQYFDSARGDAPSLLHHVDPCVGITDEDLAAVGAWFTALKGR